MSLQQLSVPRGQMFAVQIDAYFRERLEVPLVISYSTMGVGLKQTRFASRTQFLLDNYLQQGTEHWN